VVAFKKAKRVAADKAIMMFFACEGIPFNKARSPWFKEMISAVATASSGYTLPAYNAMRTTLLDDLKASTERDMVVFDLRSKEAKVTICSGGWTDDDDDEEEEEEEEEAIAAAGGDCCAKPGQRCCGLRTQLVNL
jgi:hypothetical protein